MNVLTLLALGLGALLGTGIALLVWQTRPATPALAPALARMTPGAAPLEQAHAAKALVGKALGSLMLADADLLVLRSDRKKYLVWLGVSAGLGLIVPWLLTFILNTFALTLPFALPAIVSVAGAVVMLVMYARREKARAARARRHFRKGVAIYLNLVAGNVANGFGTVECLERAATVCHGPVFDMIRMTLNRSRRLNQEPWDQLRELGKQLQVPALSDLGDNMRSSGTQGADVYDTLRESRSSLRKQIRFANLANSTAGLAKLGSIGAQILVIGLILAAYPFIVRLGMI